MSYDLTDDQRAFQETARRFAREKLAPGYQRREVEGRIDRALVREMGALGLIAPELPEEMGGLGAPSLTSTRNQS
jgi:cyclohexanecarboxyl-CoA dehydrogenase